MPTTQPEDQAFLSELGREIVAQVAPDEIEVFDELAEEYFMDPSPSQLEPRSSDDALGFGLDSIMMAATPAVMGATMVVFSFVAQVATQILVDQSAEFTRSRVKRWLLRKQPEPIVLSQEHLARAHQLAMEEAARHGLNEAVARQMADVLIRRLVTES